MLIWEYFFEGKQFPRVDSDRGGCDEFGESKNYHAFDVKSRMLPTGCTISFGSAVAAAERAASSKRATPLIMLSNYSALYYVY